MTPDPILEEVCLKEPLAREVWQSAYNRYSRFWLNLARSTHVSEDEAKDLLHAVLATILSDPQRKFESLEHIRNYVARAVINRAIEHKKISSRNTEWNETSEIETLVSQEVSGPELKELREILRAGVRHLPFVHFQIIKLRFFAGFTFQEISNMLGLPISTLKSREEAALKRIRKALRRNGF